MASLSSLSDDVPSVLHIKRKGFYDFVVKETCSSNNNQSYKICISPAMPLMDSLLEVYKARERQLFRFANKGLNVIGGSVTTGASGTIALDDEKAEAFLQSIESVRNNGVELYDFIFDREITLADLESPSTPLMSKPTTLQLRSTKAVTDVSTTSIQTTKRVVINPFEVMMGNSVVRILYLESKEVVDDCAVNLDKQVEAKVLEYFKENRVGYSSGDMLLPLKKNVGYICSVLCFVHSHWSKLLKKQRPEYPPNCCALLKAIACCERNGSK
jgi:hypothetical protein